MKEYLLPSCVDLGDLIGCCTAGLGSPCAGAGPELRGTLPEEQPAQGSVGSPCISLIGDVRDTSAVGAWWGRPRGTQFLYSLFCVQ